MTGGGDEVVGAASPHDDGISDSPLRDAPKAIFTSIFQDERDRFGKILPSGILRSALTVGARNLRAVGDEPVAVLLDDRDELVSHVDILREIRARCSRLVPPNGLTLTGADRTRQSIAPGTTAARSASGAALSWVALQL